MNASAARRAVGRAGLRGPAIVCALVCGGAALAGTVGGANADSADRILRESAGLTASHPARNDQLGWSVAISGRTIVVGDPFRAGSGRAFVFVRPRRGWTGALRPSATLVGPPGSIRFGWSVAVSGNTIAVGSPGHYQEPGIHPSGNAYVFVRPRSGWSGKRSPTTALIPSTLAAGDVLGDSVAVAGHTVVVGATGHDVGGRQDQGAAYVFTRPRSGWPRVRSQAATLLGSDGRAFDLFSLSLAASGHTVVVGARQHRISRLQLGQAYVFTRPRSGWSGTRHQDARLRASHRIGAFADSVAISGRTIVAGPGSPESSGLIGDALVFTRPAGGWHGTHKETARLRTPARATSTTCGVGGEYGAVQDYGTSIAVSGDMVVVGAGPYAIGHHHFSGKVCVFAKPASGWAGTITQATTLTPSDGREGDLFASVGVPTAVAVSGRTIVAGAPFHTVRGHRDAGKAYVFTMP